MSGHLVSLLAETWFVVLAGSLFGLAIGSFLNVVIHRLPIVMERAWRAECAALAGETPPSAERFDLLLPRSRCPACGTGIRAVDNVPVLGYLLLRGRCRSCQAAISPRYPLVELLTAVLTVVTLLHFGIGVQGVAAALLTWALIALSFIDFDRQLLPDSLTLPLLWLGLLLSLQGVFVDTHAALVGAMAGYLSLWAVYHAFRLLTGKEGMGYGDFKLFAVFGAWLGWEALPLIILLSSAVGAAFGIGMILLRGRDRSIPMPFGPYLAAAGWIALLWGERLIDWYLGAALPA